MIQVTVPPKSRRIFLIPVILLSVVVHVIMFWAVDTASNQPRTPKYDSGRIAFVAKPEPVKPEPPKMEPPKPQELKPPDPEPERTRRPKPNRKKLPKSMPKEPPTPVFGVTDASVVGSKSSVSVRVGNTLEKEMEKKYTTPSRVAPLAPVEDTSLPVSEKPPAPLIPVPVYELSSTPTFKTKIEPVYPDNARKAEIEGVVQLEVLIDARGRVRKVKVIKTPGYGLEKAAISALSRSKFNPGKVNGKPVPVKIKIPYRFVLDT